MLATVHCLQRSIYSSGNIDDFRILKTCETIYEYEGDLVAMSNDNLLDLQLTWEDDEYNKI